MFRRVKENNDYNKKYYRRTEKQLDEKEVYNL